MRDTIAKQAEQIRALKAQINTQAEMITARNIKILQQARKIAALEGVTADLQAQVARTPDLGVQHRPQRPERASEG